MALNRNIAIALTADTRGFIRDVNAAAQALRGLQGGAGAIRGDIGKTRMPGLGGGLAEATKFTKALNTMPATVGRVSMAFKGLGVQIALAFGVVGLISRATTALVGFFSSGIKGAVDLGETMNKVNETFGSSTSIVSGMADELAGKFGMVKGPMLDAAAGFGLIAQAGGLSQEAAAKMSANLTKLAADATSFYNIPLEDSLQKIKAGLVGEAEPLRSLGVLLSEDAVKAEAMAMGLGKAKDKLTDSAKVQARASLITKGLATASGDMERTMGDVSNQFRAAGGGVSNFATQVGTMLTPMIKTAVVAFNELLATVLTVFDQNKSLIEGWVNSVKTGFDTVAMVLRNAGDYFTIFQLAAGAAVSNVLAYVEVIPKNLALVADYIAGNWLKIITDAINRVATLYHNLGTNIGNVAGAIYNFLKDPTGGFVFEWTPLLEGFKATAAQLPALIKPELIDVQDLMSEVFTRIGGREAARAKGAAAGPAARPEAAKEAAAGKPTGTEYKATAAVEVGSAEAAGALARFYNQSGDTAKQTAANTKQTAGHTKNMAQALREIAAREGTQTTGLQRFTF